MTRRAKAGIGIPLGVLLISWSLLLTPAHSCPFCTAVRNTLSEEFAMMDAVVLARLVKSAPPGSAAEDLACAYLQARGQGQQRRQLHRQELERTCRHTFTKRFRLGVDHAI